jgi:hypothetical protein
LFCVVMGVWRMIRSLALLQVGRRKLQFRNRKQEIEIGNRNRKS